MEEMKPEQVLELWRRAKEKVEDLESAEIQTLFHVRLLEYHRQVMSVCRELAEMKKEEAIDYHRSGEEIDQWQSALDKMKDSQ